MATTINIHSIDDLIDGVNATLKLQKTYKIPPIEIIDYWHKFIIQYEVKKEISDSLMQYIKKEIYK